MEHDRYCEEMMVLRAVRTRANATHEELALLRERGTPTCFCHIRQDRRGRRFRFTQRDYIDLIAVSLEVILRRRLEMRGLVHPSVRSVRSLAGESDREEGRVIRVDFKARKKAD